FCKHEQSPYFQKLAGTAFALPSYQVAPVWVQLGINPINTYSSHSNVHAQLKNRQLPEFQIPFLYFL
ncbi:MAG: hypothetical protein FWG02_11130, partial [Holophagaceae bacterium]|nr:hypothetical protein [Holophagaceae bacterium]